MVIFSLSSVLIPFVGQNLGAKNFERIFEGRKFAHAVAYVLGIGLFILFFFIAPFIARIFSSDNMVFMYLCDYLRIISLGYFAIGLVIMCSSELVGLHKPIQSTMLQAIRLFIVLLPLVLVLGKFFGVIGIFSGITIANFIGAYIAVFVVNREFKRIVAVNQ
jgi:Na+-driven multidrug efflux pump